MIKRVCLLSLLLLSLLVSVVSAETNPTDENRWYWVRSTDNTGVYIDKQNIEYDPATDSVNLWVMYYTPTEEKSALEKIQIFYTENLIKTYKQYTYKRGNDFPVNVIDRIVTDEIIPGTFGESIKNVSLTLINRDEQLAEYKKQQEEEAKQQEQEQKEQEKEQRNKEITNTAIGIIGSLF